MKKLTNKLNLFGNRDFNINSAPSSTEISRIIEFYELVYLYYVIGNDFDKAEQKFSLLEFYYKQLNAKSANQSTFYSLHLLYLFSSNKEVEYNCLLENLDSELRNSAEVQKVITFADMVNLGNYTNAIDFARRISTYHALIMSRLEETKILENSRLIDLFSNDLSIDDITKFFNINNQREFDNFKKHIDDLFNVSL